MEILAEIKALLNDDSVTLGEQVQSLWSGYGQIVRCYSAQQQASYIVKAIAPANATRHPRGWNTSASHQRKLKSYQVEANFYLHYAKWVSFDCKVPQLLACKATDDFTLLVMEDLDALGYSERKDFATWHDLSRAIKWLAYFHARFMKEVNDGPSFDLWPMGTYWHLATRQDELAAMPDNVFKTYAGALDTLLQQVKFPTLLHGDAKFANLCFHTDGELVAAIDFQYVGLGSGVRDLAYLVGSCLKQDKLMEYDRLIVPEYLKYLQQALNTYGKTIDFSALQAETELLYPVAWADFYRFLLGWNPKSWKIGDYMLQKAQQGLDRVL
ncbi:choline kinase [Saccharobesus litoralis]|uniref:Choline kinase n=1 Tax=Saccharobesus litoralis TaxID=2172099 RepID=A0A2S0VPI0_9ALTE|nr:phosphotransferase [Saccharobesus litoralis]AWB66114.1 choline kinase [Saccharobesus litoralis]